MTPEHSYSSFFSTLLLHVFLSLLIITLLCYLFILLVVPNGKNLYSLHYRESDLTRYILPRMKHVLQSFQLQFWSSHPTIQAFLHIFNFSPSHIYFKREVFQLRDRGLVCLHWAIHPCKPPSEKLMNILLILPSPLAVHPRNFDSSCTAALKAGFQPVIMSSRGGFGAPMATTRKISIGDPSDLRQVIKYLHTQNDINVKIFAIGLGTGATLLIAYLGEFGSSSYLSGVVATSSIWDPVTSLSGSSLIHWIWLTLEKFRLIQQCHVIKPDAFNQLLTAPSLKAMEEVHCKSHSESSTSFWESVDPLRDADEISVPLLALQSTDDVISPPETVPKELFTIYPHFILALTNGGGHCGFVKHLGSPPWWCEVALQFLSLLQNFHEEENYGFQTQKRFEKFANHGINCAQTFK